MWSVVKRYLRSAIECYTRKNWPKLFFFEQGAFFENLFSPTSQVLNCFYRPFESYRKNVIISTIFMKFLCAHRQTVPQTFVILHDTTRKAKINSARKIAFFSKNLGFQPPLRYWRKSPINCKMISRKPCGAKSNVSGCLPYTVLREKVAKNDFHRKKSPFLRNCSYGPPKS